MVSPKNNNDHSENGEKKNKNDIFQTKAHENNSPVHVDSSEDDECDEDGEYRASQLQQQQKASSVDGAAFASSFAYGSSV